MKDQTNAQLLRAYAEHRSEPAFVELARRHVDIVYSAALRMVCDAHLAQDVTQGVFLALARSAAQLTNHPVLSGWLHRTAQNIAAQTVRTDVRRRVREQEAAAMNELLSTEPAAVWEHIAPHLDAALGELSEADRDAVLLRYFERKSASEMAQRLGISDEAAQKRVNRAVERLREFFAKRGLTVGASGLVAVICANAVQAAPVGLALTISTAAKLTGITAATTTLATQTTMNWLNIKSAIAITVTALTAGKLTHLVQQRETNRLRSENQNLIAQQGKLIAERDTALSATGASNDEIERLQKNQDELLRLRGEVGLLRQQQAELSKLRDELIRQQEQSRAASAAKAAAEEVIQRFEGQRSMTINAMKRVGVQLRALATENKLNSAFTADGSLNPALLEGNRFDLRKVQLLVNNPSQLEKLLSESPESIVARTVDPIPTPDGRWMYIYTLADGSVQSYSGEFPGQAFTGNLQIEIVKPRP